MNGLKTRCEMLPLKKVLIFPFSLFIWKINTFIYHLHKYCDKYINRCTFIDSIKFFFIVETNDYYNVFEVLCQMGTVVQDSLCHLYCTKIVLSYKFTTSNQIPLKPFPYIIKQPWLYQRKLSIRTIGKHGTI